MATDSSVERRREVGSLLAEVHEKAGARFQEGAGGIRVPRHYGDPGSEYDAAVGSCAVADRSDRARWLLRGRDPARMLDGIVTNTIPGAPRPLGGNDPTSDPGAISDGQGGGGSEESEAAAGWCLLRGRAPYGLTLTPKGKVISDHRLSRLPENDGDAFLMDLPSEGVAGMEAHFERFLPPRFATVVDLTGSTGMLSVVGPAAAGSLAAALEDITGAVEASGVADHLAHLEEGELLQLLPPGPLDAPATGRGEAPDDGGLGELGYLVVASGELGSRGSGAPEVLDVVASRRGLRRLWAALRKEGCAPLGRAAWETLRVEGGRPAFGPELSDGTIPVEAGVHDRAIDYQKGCYTGQEVIVRIRDRGRVNRHLRRILLGDRPTPPAGTALFRHDGGRQVGGITSAVESPRFGQAIALGYVRREVEPPARVRLGSPEGPTVEVRSLDRDGSGSDGGGG